MLIPLLFMGDIVGRLFREFAVTLAVTILVSAVVSLTLTPMMCSKLLKHKPEAAQGRLFRASERAFEAVIALYGRMLRFVLRWQTATLLVAAGTLALTVLPVLHHSQGLLPHPGYGRHSGRFGSRRRRCRFPRCASLQQRLTKVILTDPAVESLSSFIGIDGTNTTLNSGRILINLKPLDERKISASDVIRRLQPQLGGSGRHHPVHAARAGPDGGRPRQPHAVPIHPGRPQRGRVEQPMRPKCWPGCRNCRN